MWSWREQEGGLFPLSQQLGRNHQGKWSFQKRLLRLMKMISMLSPIQHAILYKTRRASAVALAVAEEFAKQTGLDALRAKNSASSLERDEATQYRKLLEASAYVAVFAASAYLHQFVETSGEPANDVEEPHFNFDTPQDALKTLIGALDQAASDAKDDGTLESRIRACADISLEELLQRKNRFSGLGSFEETHLRLDSDGFELNGFDVAPGAKTKPLIMTFKRPDEIVGNHIAKYQSLKLAKMLMAYDFDRQLNPFVELGGFLFTFIGDGSPGTGKTILIQMIAGLINDYCQVAGYGFTYENFGVDQISSYQGKSGQNCKQFVSNVLESENHWLWHRGRY